MYINVKMSQLIGPKFVVILMKDRNAYVLYIYMYMDIINTIKIEIWQS